MAEICQLGSWRQNAKKCDFLKDKQFRARCLLTTCRKSQRTHYGTPKIQDGGDLPSWILMPICKNTIFSKIKQFRAMVSTDDFKAKSVSWSCHNACCKNSICHIENRFSPIFNFFVCFLIMQFGLWRAAAFVSSPILLLDYTTCATHSTILRSKGEKLSCEICHDRRAKYC